MYRACMQVSFRGSASLEACILSGGRKASAAAEHVASRLSLARCALDKPPVAYDGIAVLAVQVSAGATRACMHAYMSRSAGHDGLGWLSRPAIVPRPPASVGMWCTAM